MPWWGLLPGNAATYMHADALLDTNVLIYSISRDAAEAGKREIANRLIETKDFGVSTQICQEFFVVSTQKIKEPISPDEAADFIRLLISRPLVIVDPQLIFRAIDIQKRFGISYWDSALIAAAHELGAAVVYSEDLNHKQHYGATQVINPFLAAPRVTA
jgi:predicted nucleic acid-binding protein